ATETEKLAVFRREILPILRATKSVTEREHYIRLCAPLHPYYKDKDTLAEEQIRQELEGNRPGGAPWRSQGWVGARSGRRDYEEGYRKGKYRDETEFGQRTFGGPKYGNNPNSVINGKHGGTPPYGPIPIIVRTAEVVLLRALLGDDEELKRIITTGICPEHFPTLEYRALAEKQFAEVRLEPALDKPGEGEFDLESLRAKILLEPEIQVTEADVKKGIEDSVVCLKKWALRSRLIELRLKAVEGDDAAIAELPALEKQFRER
ncbi:MAG TPA: hypothetical protein VFW40_08780, partial [Capsulimonadaceae bacterium]|nr:hypothetical protein [Capsulimonadaceae bacterium]